MRENSRRLKLKPVLLIVVIAVLLVAGFRVYISDIQASLWDQAVSEVLEVTSQGSHAFEVYIEKDMQILTRIVKHLSTNRSGEEAAIREDIRSFEDEDVTFTVIDEKHGVMYGGDGKDVRTVDPDVLAMYRAFDDTGIREPYRDDYTGEDMLGGYARFSFADGVSGVVQVQRKMSNVADEFMLSFYHDTGFSYIVDKQGDVLVRPSHKNSNHEFSNILDAILFSENDGQDVQRFQEGLIQQEEGVMRLVFDGEQTILAYTSVKGTNGWHLIAIVPDAVIMNHANEILKSSQLFLILFVGILVIAGLFLYTGWQSEKKIMEKEGDVQYRERLFSILANNTNDVFLMFTPTDYTAEYISPNIERVLGIRQDEVKQNIRFLEESMADEDKVLRYDAIKNLEMDDSVVQEMERIHRTNGERRWFRETVYKTVIGSSKRYVAVLSDRTQERRSEQALKEALEIAKTANESKSVFLSNMSHDIRTPMNAVVGLSALLQRDAYKPEKVQEYTRKISAASQHLLGLINDVLDMSKIESGKTTLNISEVSLAEIVDELLTIMQPQAKAKRQQFKIQVYDLTNEEVLGDRLRINQILINILSNALKYTPEGGMVEMTVRQMKQSSKNFAHFHFVIKDNGIGMSEEYLQTIFQPFSRETNSKTHGIQGTGLGMAITKNLVDLMGGTIQVESKLGEGSTFFLDLGFRVKEQDVDPQFWEKNGVTKLLVVDDDEEICLGVKTAMTGTGVNTEYATGGQDAVKMAESAQAEGRGYDLVLVDWQMPDISGIETARRIRKIVSPYVPIMVLTAYDISRIEEEGMAAGIDGYMQKPFFLSNFKMIVGNLKAGSNDREDDGNSAVQPEHILEGKHILAVEDIERNAEILMEMLKTTGASCEWVCNGREALERFQQSAPGEFDVILMDVQMPVMNGYEATRAIRRSEHPQAKTVPIIAMTANAFSEDVKEALDAGMDQHVAKPIDMQRLQSVIREVIEKGCLPEPGVTAN